MGQLLNDAGRNEDVSRLLRYLRARAETRGYTCNEVGGHVAGSPAWTEEALALYLRLVEIGETDALEEAARLPSRAGAPRRSASFAGTGSSPGGGIAAGWSVVDSSIAPQMRTPLLMG